MRGLYIHIPFCKSICTYCDFTKRVSNENIFEKYIDRLILEIDSYKENLFNIDTVYIGGGTPNILSIRLLEKLFNRISGILSDSKENTIELNPELVTDELCKLLNKYNFNRVSLGVQTVKDESIKLLNRHHNKNDIINSFKYLRNNNINNINCDLIFGIPNTNINDVKNDLDFILSLDPTHISYYDLIIEDKTILKFMIDNNKIEKIDDDIEADMYDYIKNRLKNSLYHHYEISNFSKPGYESIHNMIYWNIDEYIGVGLGASGNIKNQRIDNTKDLKVYLKDFKREISEIDIETRKSEFMMLGLRLVDGISINRYKELFNSSIFDDFKNIDDLVNKKLIEINDDKIKINDDKLFVANIIWKEFV